MDQEVSWFDIAMNHIILMHHLQSVTNLHQDILNLRLAKPPLLRFHIRFQILLAILKEEVKMLGRFGRLVELYYVGTFQFEQNLYLTPHHLFVFDALEGNRLHSQKLVFVILDISSVNCTETALSQLNRSDHVSLNYLARHLSDWI